MQQYDFQKLSREEQEKVLRDENDKYQKEIQKMAQKLYPHREVLKDFYKLLCAVHQPLNPSPTVGPAKADVVQLAYRDGVRGVLVGVSQFLKEAEANSNIVRPQ